MKTEIIITGKNQQWERNRGIMKRIFASITGYDIMFEESRKDQAPVKRLV